MIYSVRHVTTFRYEPAVRESVMEVRLMPRSETFQRCHTFNLHVDPATNIMQYRDFTGNIVHHFDIPGSHTVVKVTAQSLVEVQSRPLPLASDAGDWSDLDTQIASEDHWEMLLFSQYVKNTPALLELAAELNCERRGNPLDLVTELNQGIYEGFSYSPNSTKVDSPIDEALESRQGVCQDFAHILLALLRGIKMPARYVSGYLFHGADKKDRSLEGASHAWIEALIPKLGWIAFDPTNNLIGGDRHIRVAIGRDYADVPPTRGVYKGDAQSELSVAVTVSPSTAPLPDEMVPSVVIRSRPNVTRPPAAANNDQQQQQQQ